MLLTKFQYSHEKQENSLAEYILHRSLFVILCRRELQVRLLIKIKVLFDLSQYKFVLNQDSNAIDTIDKVFGHTFTSSELNDIPKLSKGQTILSIQGTRNIAFNIECTDEELELFRGGA